MLSGKETKRGIEVSENKNNLIDSSKVLYSPGAIGFFTGLGIIKNSNFEGTILYNQGITINPQLKNMDSSMKGGDGEKDNKSKLSFGISY